MMNETDQMRRTVAAMMGMLPLGPRGMPVLCRMGLEHRLIELQRLMPHQRLRVAVPGQCHSRKKIGYQQDVEQYPFHGPECR